MIDTVSVVTIDAHPLYRAGIAQYLHGRPRFRVIGEVTDGSRAISTISELAPSVAVVDPVTPGVDALQILGALRRDDVPTRVVLLTADVRPGAASEALAAGAAAYLSKRATGDQVAQAINRVAMGETVIGVALEPDLRRGMPLRETAQRPALTPREHEILELLVAGLTVPKIACRLTLSPDTVKTHTRHIYSKLGVRSRAAAVATALRLGLLA